MNKSTMLKKKNIAKRFSLTMKAEGNREVLGDLLRLTMKSG